MSTLKLITEAQIPRGRGTDATDRALVRLADAHREAVRILSAELPITESMTSLRTTWDPEDGVELRRHAAESESAADDPEVAGREGGPAVTPQDELVSRLSELHRSMERALAETRKLVDEAGKIPHHTTITDFAIDDEPEYAYVRESLHYLADELLDAISDLPEPRIGKELPR